MQFAIHYTNLFRHYNDIDEVIFDFQDLNRDQIVDFIPTIVKNDNQKIIVNISYIEEYNIEDVLPYLMKLKSIHPNLLIQIDFIKQKHFIELLNDNNIDFMFSNYCNNYDTFYSMINLGAKEVYVVEILAFDLKSLQEIRKEKNIKLRIIPDIAQSAGGTRTTIPEITKFWVRPEDVELYEKYVDIFELIHIDKSQSIIYEIYKQQQWKGNVQDIILDLDLKINNDNIAPRFGQYRINCRKKCMLNKCNLCEEIYNLAEKFDMADISIVKTKKKEPLTKKEKIKLIQSIKR